jgi:hypothetical protein
MSFPDLKLVSTNDAYIPTAGSVKAGHKRRSAFLRRSNELIEFQREFIRRIMSFYSEELQKFKDTCSHDFERLGFQLRLAIGMPDMNYKRKSISYDIRPYDVSNYIKTVEDVISRALEVDDRYNMEVHIMKYKLLDVDEEFKSRDHWKLDVEIIPVNYETYTKNTLFVGDD